MECSTVEVPTVETLISLALNRYPPLSVAEHQKLSLVAAISCYSNSDFAKAQAFLADSLRQAQHLGVAIEECLYWSAVFKYECGEFVPCKATCEGILSKVDLPLELRASVSLLLSNVIALLPDTPIARLPIPPTLAVAHTLLPEFPREISRNAVSKMPGVCDFAQDHLRRTRTAFGLTYVARMAEAMTDRGFTGNFRSDAAFLNLASHYELRQDVISSYARVVNAEIPKRPSPGISDKPKVADVVGRRVSTTRALLAIGSAEHLGRVAEEVVEAEEDISERMRFWAARARGVNSTEEARFAAARKLALIADDIHDFRLLEEAVTLASEFSGPQSMFYKELQEMLRKFDDKKSDIYFLPANPPGLQNSGPPTPRATEASRRSSRVSTGGLPALSPWKPSMAELSP